jgi:hypothetical protein
LDGSQIVTNLVANAVKFTASGSVTVTASVLTAPPPNYKKKKQLAAARKPDNGSLPQRHAKLGFGARVSDGSKDTAQFGASNVIVQGPAMYLSCSVADTGIGIKQQDMRYLFKPFSQIDSTFSRQFQGTGLGMSALHRQLSQARTGAGLAICRNLVRLLEGDIWVESVPGKGSTFSFFVRVDLDVPGSSGHAAPTTKAAALSPVRTVSKELLVPQPISLPPTKVVRLSPPDTTALVGRESDDGKSFATVLPGSTEAAASGSGGGGGGGGSGGGAEVKMVSLPAFLADGAAPGAGVVAVGDRQGRTEPSVMRFLVVDQDATNRRLLCR